MAGGAAKLAIHVLEALGPQVLIPLQHPLLRRREHAVEASQHGEGQDDVGVLAPLEVVTQNLIRDRPDEVRDLLKVVHGHPTEVALNRPEYRVRSRAASAPLPKLVSRPLRERPVTAQQAPEFAGRSASYSESARPVAWPRAMFEANGQPQRRSHQSPHQSVVRSLPPEPLRPSPSLPPRKK